MLNSSRYYIRQYSKSCYLLKIAQIIQLHNNSKYYIRQWSTCYLLKIAQLIQVHNSSRYYIRQWSTCYLLKIAQIMSCYKLEVLILQHLNQNAKSLTKLKSSNILQDITQLIKPDLLNYVFRILTQHGSVLQKLLIRAHHFTTKSFTSIL